MNTTPFTSTISFSLTTENIQLIVSFLISNRISFTLTTSTCLEKDINDTPYAQTKSIENRPPINLENQKNTTIEAIYQKYLVEEIAQVPPTEKQIAAKIGVPLIKLNNAFKSTYGKPFYQLYMQKRMEYAAQLLQKGYKANEVSKRVGYGEKSCIKFNKMFQKHFGMTPKKYQLLFGH